MNRHSLRWSNLAFGMFFLAAVGQWAVWRQDLLTPRELSLTAAGVLIVVGVVGVAATLRHVRPTASSTTSEGDSHEQAADPYA
jgi:hypothetical protein